MSTARWIDVVMGVIFAVFGLWGLIPAAGGMVLGLFPVNTAMCVIALIAAAVLFYGAVDLSAAKSVAGSVGIVFGLAGVVGLFSRDLFGLIPASGWNIGLFLVSAALLVYDWLGTPEEDNTLAGRTPLR